MKELDELKRVMEFESKTNGRIPKPNYLYVANYGRKVTEYEKQFKIFAGKKSSFYFKPIDTDDKSLESSFDNEINRNKPIGKEYDGVIFVDLSMLEPEGSELDKFIGYLKDNYSNNYIVFEINNLDKADAVLRTISNHFFARIIEAPEYSTKEMIDIIELVMREYNAAITGKSLKKLVTWATKKEWDITDYVESKIISVTKDILYEIGINGNNKSAIDKKVQDIIEKASVVKRKKIAMGFQLGG